MILDDDNSYKACARDEAEGAISDVDTRRIERDASPHNTLITSELVLEPAKPIDASGPWDDAEDSCYIDGPAPGLRSCEQQDVVSAPTQDQTQILPQSFTPLQDQMNQQDIDNITQSMSVESAPHSLPKPPNNGDNGWTDDSMAELEKELGLALGEQVKPPTSSSPRSVEAPQDEIQSRESSETTSSRLKELQEVSRHGTARGLEEWEHRGSEVVVVVEELGQPAVGDQQDLVEVADADDPEDKEATEPLPATQPEIPEIDEHRFRLRGVRVRQLPGRQTKKTQYRVVWGEHPNRSDSWFNEDDVQISMPREPYSQDLALQVDIFRVCGMRSSLRKGRKVFEYLVDRFGLDSRTWTTEDQLRISLNPMLVAELKGN